MNLETCVSTWSPTVLGVIPEASNDTYVVVLSQPTGVGVKAVYKPVRGEAFLYDFSELARREVAAYRLSRLSGLDCVPVTVERTDMPYGEGSVQVFVDTTGEDMVDAWPQASVPDNVAPVLSAEDREGNALVVGHVLSDRIADITIFDVLANNADRKGSHLIHGRLPFTDTITTWAIDNGLSFHTEPKLRTVLWGYAGTQLAPRHEEACERTLELDEDDLGITTSELRALHARAHTLLTHRVFPAPPLDRTPIPWPPL